MPALCAEVTLIGLDFGSTTSSAVFAAATLARRTDGRMEVGALEERYRSEIVFTPFADGALDLPATEALLDHWLDAAGARPEAIFGGGAIITGLAARAQNAAELARIIRARIGDAVLAVAEDPCLEAWVAFMGSAAPLSRARPGEPIVNLDIGGGTTNLALGVGGEVLRTGCLRAGARHVALDARTRQIQALSPEARALLDHLGIRRDVGDPLAQSEAEAVVAFHVDLIEATLEGRAEALATPVAALHSEEPFSPPAGIGQVTLTFSGGVGELIYAGLQGRSLPERAFYGDLGVDLARRILASPRLMKRVATPASMGRATAFGLLRHATQIAGATLCLPRPEVLPLRDLPILARLSPASTDGEIDHAIDLFRRSGRAGCVEIHFEDLAAATVRALGRRIADALCRAGPAAGQRLVLLTPENVGKALGAYATAWGTLPFEVLVIDEVDPRGARFAHIGRPRGPILPISFFGMTPEGPANAVSRPTSTEESAA